jgi:broad specificity phosphatase PhoE
MPMRKLILVKHAAPQVVPGVPPEKWALSDQGKHRCGPLAEALRAYQPEIVVSSLEPKADETGELVAGHLTLPFEAVEGLHEHDRSNVPHLPSREFISLMELFFRRPAERALGRESADEALRRFEAAVERVLADHEDRNVAIVSHGTVIALFVAKHGGGKAFDLWRQMGLPSFRVLGLPGYSVEAAEDAVG